MLFDAKTRLLAKIRGQEMKVGLSSTRSRVDAASFSRKAWISQNCSSKDNCAVGFVVWSKRERTDNNLTCRTFIKPG